MAGALNYMPKGVPVSVIGYWRPQHGAMVGSDMITVLRGAKNPVLAHHFLNFLLDNEHGVENFSWIGYMPPLKAINPSKVIAQGYIPKNLGSTIVREDDFTNGVTLLPLSTAGPVGLAGRLVDLQGRLSEPRAARMTAPPLLAALRASRSGLARPPLPRPGLRASSRSRSGRSTRSSRTRCPCGTRCTGSSTTMRARARRAPAGAAVLDRLRADVRLRRRSRSPAASRSAIRSRTTSRATRGARRRCCSCC